jgi:membrane-associated phospholipid phosphatase
VLWKLQRGEITDFHINKREQRIKPLFFTLACSVTAGLSLWAGQAPLALMLFATMGILQVGFLLLITLRWKISGHGTAIASLAVFLVGLFGNMAAPILLAIPLVAWARVRLNRHDLSQTSAGALVGAAFMGALLYLISLSCQGAEIICR